VVSVRVKAPREDASLDSQDMPDFPQEFADGTLLPAVPRPKRSPTAPAAPFAMSLGSGFLISDDGYVVTNNHVIDKGQAVTVISDDGTEYTAKSSARDDKTDLALLKIDAGGKKFTYVKFSEGDVRVGDWVVAVGQPVRPWRNGHRRYRSPPAAAKLAPVPMMTSSRSMPREPGQFGRPDLQPQRRGDRVNTAIFSPSGGNVGIAFDIPAATAERIIQDLKEHGSVTRGWLGVQIQSITPEIAASLSSTATRARWLPNRRTAAPPPRRACRPATRLWPSMGSR